MLTTIHITVRDRVPTITAGEDVISHNSDYVAEFEFDEEWQDKVKTVYFVCEDGSYQAVVMSGNSCGVPMLDGEHRRIFVGVQAGAAEKPSVLKTTRPCCLKVKDSIADYLGQPIPDPTPDVYEQIIAMLESITSPTWDALQNKPFSTLGSGLSVDENGVLSVEGGGGGNAPIATDKSLTQSGMAADAKAVGDRLDSLSEAKVNLPTNADGTPNHGTVGYYAVSDGAGGITWVASGNTGGGTDEPITPTTHGIVWDLANVTSSNPIASVADGASLVAVLTPADGYTLGDVTVTMGGEVVTDVWNADTATVTIASVTGDVMISCAGVEQGGSFETVRVYPTWAIGQLDDKTGEHDNGASINRYTSDFIDCLKQDLQINVPVTSEYYSADATTISYKVFAYDENGTYVSASSDHRWITCNHGETITRPKGYKYRFVNNYVNGNFTSRVAARTFCETELEIYLIGTAGSTITTNKENSVMMLSFNRAYVDTGEYTEDLLPKWDGMFSIHRGYSTAPNNTLQAIWEAKKHGYNCCELDVRYTSDNQVVLNHDATVTGTVDGVEVTYTIADTPLATLQTVCIGNTAFPDAKVCSLEDAMRLCRRIGMRPEIDYKVSGTSNSLYADCVALSMKYGLQDDTLHCCYSIPYALTIKAAYEKANLRVAGELLDSDTSLDAYLPKPGNLYAFYSAAACGKTDGSNVGENVENETRILANKARGYKMYVWGVTPNLLPDVMQWEPDILQLQSGRESNNFFDLIRKLNNFDGLVI